MQLAKLVIYCQTWTADLLPLHTTPSASLTYVAPPTCMPPKTPDCKLQAGWDGGRRETDSQAGLIYSAWDKTSPSHQISAYQGQSCDWSNARAYQAAILTLIDVSYSTASLHEQVYEGSGRSMLLSSCRGEAKLWDVGACRDHGEALWAPNANTGDAMGTFGGVRTAIFRPEGLLVSCCCMHIHVHHPLCGPAQHTMQPDVWLQAGICICGDAG